MALSTRFKKFIEQRWYSSAGILWLLFPFELLFCLLANIQRRRLEAQQTRFEVPVIIVGNIAVGGTGKSPVLTELVHFFTSKGLVPGVVSRGYGRSVTTPLLVSHDTPVAAVGDEPKMIAEQCRCPVAVGADRVEATKLLLDSAHVDVILSDDGLQHNQLGRDIEIIVVDALRGFGNGHLLPVGPLREKKSRLREAQWVVVTSSDLVDKSVGPELENLIETRIEVTGLRKLGSRELLPLTVLEEHENIVAVAGIGNPDKFFKTLDRLGLVYQKKVFADHHHFENKDFIDINGALVMTDKDAIKCESLALTNAYALQIKLSFPDDFLNTLYEQYQSLVSEIQ